MNAERTEPSRRVLIAEDSPTQLQHLAHILEADGFEVSRAANGWHWKWRAARNRGSSLAT
jgi:DNA-binding response OmpR family regulator